MATRDTERYLKRGIAGNITLKMSDFVQHDFGLAIQAERQSAGSRASGSVAQQVTDLPFAGNGIRMVKPVSQQRDSIAQAELTSVSVTG